MTETLGEAVQRLLDDRERQGLPRHVEDSAALVVIAAAIQDTTPTRWKGRTRKARRQVRALKATM